MYITIKSKISCSRFYHSDRKDYYNKYSDEEKFKLKSYILSKKFKDVMMIYLKADKSFHGSVEIKNISFVESDDGNNLNIILQFSVDNNDNYTNNKIIKMLSDNFRHYYRSSQIDYGKKYYYSLDTNVNNVGSYLCSFVEEDLDFTLKEHIVYVYQNTIEDIRNIRVSRYHFFMQVDKTDITIDDAEEVQSIESHRDYTDKTNFVRNCRNDKCKYYCYIYESKKMENLIFSTCCEVFNEMNKFNPPIHEQGKEDSIFDIASLISEFAYGFEPPVYIYITDKYHNILGEKSF